MNGLLDSDNPDAPFYVGSSLEWAFDKGIINDSNEVTASCDTRFLIELITKLDRGYETIFQHLALSSDHENQTQNEGHDESQSSANDFEQTPHTSILPSVELHQAIEDTSNVFVEIAREVRRLQRYQKLFPNQFMMNSFHSSLLSKLSTNHEKWMKITGELHKEPCWNRLEKSEYLIEFWLKHPTYQYDLKPWQQFLYNEAPGSGINPKTKFSSELIRQSPVHYSKMSVKSKFHLIPPGGLAVWREWLTNYRNLEQRIQQTVIPEHLRSTNAEMTSVQFNDEMNRLEPMLHKYETIPFHVPLNLWNPQRDRRKVFPEDILPDLESLIGNLEGANEPIFEDTTSRGILVGSEPSSCHSVLHHGDPFLWL